MLCVREGEHMLQMKGLCRDCDISPNDGDDLCIDSSLKCSFHTINTIVGKSTMTKILPLTLNLFLTPQIDVFSGGKYHCTPKMTPNLGFLGENPLVGVPKTTPKPEKSGPRMWTP